MKFVGSVDQRKRVRSLSSTMDEERFCDTTILIGSERTEFNVNRLFLAKASPVFEAMLYECSKDDELALVKVTCDVFESALRYCYCSDDLKITENNIVGLIQFADKYQMDGLLDWGKRWLIACLCDDNFCKLFNDAISVNQGYSIGICNKYVANKRNGFDKLCESKAFNEMTVDAMRELIKLNRLRINEEKLWSCLVTWASTESSVTNEDLSVEDDDEKIERVDDQKKLVLLRSVYDLVRFGLMTNKFLASCVIPENVLSKDEIVTIFLYINGENDACGKFNTAKRAPVVRGRKQWQSSFEVGMKLDYRNDFWSRWMVGTISGFNSYDNQEYITIDVDSYSHEVNRLSGWLEPLNTHTPKSSKEMK